MKLKEFMDKHLYKEEVQDLAAEYDLKVSGNKEEIMDRVLSCEDFDLEDLTRYFYKEDLQDICRDLGISPSGTKDDVWDRIVEELDLEQSAKTVTTPVISREPSQESNRTDAQRQSLEEIILNWIPARRYKTEEGYQTELRSILEHKYGLKVQDEAGPTQVDILVNDSIPIELKKNPKREDFDRLSGQVDRNIEFYGKLIIVICQLETRDLFIEYKNRFETRYSKEELIFIIK